LAAEFYFRTWSSRQYCLFAEIYCDNSVVVFFSNKMTSIPKVLTIWNWNTLSLKKKFWNIEC